ncbi:MAG: hypothetical protein IPM16_04440 [Chloroflexi bacterium]|nr:hypothetical protein [Chloroflexota bacterium]
MKTKRLVLFATAAVMIFSLAGFASAQDVEQRGRGDLPGRMRRAPILNSVRHVVNAVSEATGLDLREIRQQLADGATLSDVVTGAGASVEDIKADLLAQLTERLAEAVANGRITQELADGLVAEASVRLDRLFEREFPGRPERGPVRERFGGI